MRNLIRNVSHKLRCAPLSTVNFARKPRIAPGATCSSGAIASFSVSGTGSILAQIDHDSPVLPVTFLAGHAGPVSIIGKHVPVRRSSLHSFARQPPNRTRAQARNDRP